MRTARVDRVVRWASLVTVDLEPAPAQDVVDATELTWTEQVALLVPSEADGSVDLAHLRGGIQLRRNALALTLETKEIAIRPPPANGASYVGGVAERWVSTNAGRHLAGRKKESTTPEVLLRKAVHAAGGRFRLHRRLAKGCTPDFVLPGRRVAVFVDGCFWHGCPRHGRKTPWSGPNAELWANKMARNAERDARSSELAEQQGWHVIRVWECAVRSDPAQIARRILEPPEQ